MARKNAKIFECECGKSYPYRASLYNHKRICTFLDNKNALVSKIEDIDYKDIIHNDKVSKISIVGAGMVSTPGITYRMFRALSDEKINILAISTSEIKLSVIIDENNALNAIKKLHTTFDLD